MTTVVLVAVLCLAAGVLLVPPRPPRVASEAGSVAAQGPDDRTRRPSTVPWTRVAGSLRGGAVPRRPDREHPVGRRARVLAAGCLGAVVASALGGTSGAVAGVLAGSGVAWWLGHQEPPAVARRRERLAADLPHVVDLLAALLRAGQGPADAAARVAVTAQGPAAEELAGVARRSRAGLDPYAVWRPLAEREGTALLGAAMLRSLDSGARVVDVVERVAEELRRDARAAATAQARTVGVRATAPLAACFLPALVLVGVVPFVASLVTPLLDRL